MAMAFAQARKVKGSTFPNPPVGAVLVKAGKVIGNGGTRPVGGNHAEIVALKKASLRARGSTLYVTLEPCSHQGRTPPCVLAVIAAGVQKVVVAVQDPNPLVGGKGIRALRKAGIEVLTGTMAEEAATFYAGFFFFIRHHRPKIILKIAQSLDGRVNIRPGVETKITGEASRRHVHEMRARADAVLIGGRTLRIDDPDLTPRLNQGPVPEALILSRRGPFPPNAKLFAKNRKAKTWVMSYSRAGVPSGVEWVQLPVPAAKTSRQSATASARTPSALSTLSTLLAFFAQRGYHSVLVEGGPEIWAHFINAGIWDTLYIATAPEIMPEGQRWDAQLPLDWGKSLKFRNFASFENDYWAEFGNSNALDTFMLGV